MKLKVSEIIKRTEELYNTMSNNSDVLKIDGKLYRVNGRHLLNMLASQDHDAEISLKEYKRNTTDLYIDQLNPTRKLLELLAKK